MIGYPSGQDGAVLTFGTASHVSQEKFPQKPYNKFFIDQACSVKMAAFYFFVCLFFCFAFFMDRDLVHKHAKKRTWPISSPLDFTLGQ